MAVVKVPLTFPCAGDEYYIAGRGDDSRRHIIRSVKGAGVYAVNRAGGAGWTVHTNGNFGLLRGLEKLTPPP